ncbi:MAG: hypothetical protein ACXAC7_10605 [Candidatus Hodarchaeales archaeon]|jgi:hypothetical protein
MRKKILLQVLLSIIVISAMIITKTNIVQSIPEKITPFDVYYVPIKVLMEAESTERYDNIIVNKQTNVHVSIQANTPYITVRNITITPYTEQLFKIIYYVTVDAQIPSGNYEVIYDITYEGVAYSGRISLRIYQQNDPDVAQVEIKGLGWKDEPRKTQLELSYYDQNKWNELSMMEGINYSLNLLHGTYRIKLIDQITGLEIVKELELYQHKILTFKYQLLNITAEYYYSNNLLNLTIENYLGIREIDVQMEMEDSNKIENYHFLIKQGLNRIKIVLPQFLKGVCIIRIKIDDYEESIVITIGEKRKNSPSIIIALSGILIFTCLVILSLRNEKIKKIF